MRKTLLVIAGPTAAGKTACGISLASEFETEIISADSRQIYRETRIGTAVPGKEELSQVRHHFIQNASVTTPYHASRYEEEVILLLEKLFRKKDLVLLVGGSGLYIDAVCQGIDELPSSDPRLRRQLLKQFQQEGLQPLVKQLRELDPDTYARVDLKNHMRVLKALEVTIQTGKPYSLFLKHSPKARPFNILRIALDLERGTLYERINQRVDRMMEEGLLSEARSLVQYRGLTPMKTVGYKELFRYLDGELSLDEAVDLIKRNTRKFARKQLTWFRKDGLYTWFRPDEKDRMLSWINDHL